MSCKNPCFVRPESFYCFFCPNRDFFTVLCDPDHTYSIDGCDLQFFQSFSVFETLFQTPCLGSTPSPIVSFHIWSLPSPWFVLWSYFPCIWATLVELGSQYPSCISYYLLSSLCTHLLVYILFYGRISCVFAWYLYSWNNEKVVSLSLMTYDVDISECIKNPIYSSTIRN